ncbi:MAG: Fic family protein [Bacilli bacterium]|nr:Fic family protein [Bacilli bacterium]
MSDNAEYKKVEETKDSYTKQLYWNMAIGLQQVDGLTPSIYLKELVNKNILGEITNYEVEELLQTYYKTQDLSNIKISNEKECDLVSTRIVELLNDNSFSLRPIILQSIHEYLFKGIYDFAGKYRTYNITKEEPILKDDTVIYADYNDIERTFEYDFKEEMKYDYSKLTLREQIEHIATFTSSIWQVHPFGEGNTRTVAVMIEKYLRSLGYNVKNDLFKENSLYFRNALVRSNYSNRAKNIYPTNEYLIKFFENLLNIGTNELSNKDLFVENN